MYAKWEEKTIYETYNAQSDSYEIYTRSQLLGIKDLAVYSPIYSENVIEKNISLCDDIDFFSTDIWTPLATYLGTFEGNGHTIADLKIIATGSQSTGFFSRIEGIGIVRNLKIADVCIVASNVGSSSIGTIADICKGEITNCTMKSGSITINDADSSCVGGLVGTCDGGTISNCATDSGFVVSGNGTLGGIVGIAGWSAIISSCENYASVNYAYKTSSRCAGGIAGKITNSAIIKNCKNYGLVKYSGESDPTNSDIKPCMGQIVGWNLSGKLEGNECHKPCEFKVLFDTQKEYCNLYEVGRIGI